MGRASAMNGPGVETVETPDLVPVSVATPAVGPAVSTIGGGTRGRGPLAANREPRRISGPPGTWSGIGRVAVCGPRRWAVSRASMGAVAIRTRAGSQPGKARGVETSSRSPRSADCGTAKTGRAVAERCPRASTDRGNDSVRTGSEEARALTGGAAGSMPSVPVSTDKTCTISGSTPDASDNAAVRDGSLEADVDDWEAPKPRWTGLEPFLEEAIEGATVSRAGSHPGVARTELGADSRDVATVPPEGPDEDDPARGWRSVPERDSTVRPGSSRGAIGPAKVSVTRGATPGDSAWIGVVRPGSAAERDGTGVALSDAPRGEATVEAREAETPATVAVVATRCPDSLRADSGREGVGAWGKVTATVGAGTARGSIVAGFSPFEVVDEAASGRPALGVLEAEETSPVAERGRVSPSPIGRWGVPPVRVREEGSFLDAADAGVAVGAVGEPPVTIMPPFPRRRSGRPSDAIFVLLAVGTSSTTGAVAAQVSGKVLGASACEAESVAASGSLAEALSSPFSAVAPWGVDSSGRTVEPGLPTDVTSPGSGAAEPGAGDVLDSTSAGPGGGEPGLERSGRPGAGRGVGLEREDHDGGGGVESLVALASRVGVVASAGGRHGSAGDARAWSTRAEKLAPGLGVTEAAEPEFPDPSAAKEEAAPAGTAPGNTREAFMAFGVRPASERWRGADVRRGARHVWPRSRRSGRNFRGSARLPPP